MNPPRSESLRALYWRSEILQVMFWLKIEGFGDRVDPPLLERFLGVDSHVDVHHLDRLLDEGYIEHVGACYRLSDAGARRAGREFAASFREFDKPAHGNCGAEPWCWSRPDE